MNTTDTVQISPPVPFPIDGFTVRFLAGALRIASAHRQAGQQHDNLCGPYWAAVLLQAQAIATTPEQIAQLAGSVLPIGDPASWVPPGASSRQDYQLPLPATENLSDAGTSAQGLMAAVSQLTAAYGFLPLQTHWTAQRLEALMQLCYRHPEWEAVPLCNIRTEHLWGNRLGIGEAIAYLQGEAITPPPADWSVGHFLTLAGTVTGSARSLVLIGDTYPQFGWQGYYLQSAEAIARALNRGDGYGGGILLFVPTAYREQAQQLAVAAGFEIRVWDNGSPAKP